MASPRNSDIETVDVDFAFNLPGTLGLNYPEFPVSCLWVGFSPCRVAIAAGIEAPTTATSHRSHAAARTPGFRLIDQFAKFPQRIALLNINHFHHHKGQIQAINPPPKSG